MYTNDSLRASKLVNLGYVVISFLQMQLMFILIQRLTLYTVYV